MRPNTRASSTYKVVIRCTCEFEVPVTASSYAEAIVIAKNCVRNAPRDYIKRVRVTNMRDIRARGQRYRPAEYVPLDDEYETRAMLGGLGDNGGS